jgi:hypothetical protein
MMARTPPPLRLKVTSSVLTEEFAKPFPFMLRLFTHNP